MLSVPQDPTPIIQQPAPVVQPQPPPNQGLLQRATSQGPMSWGPRQSLPQAQGPMPHPMQMPPGYGQGMQGGGGFGGFGGGGYQGGGGGYGGGMPPWMQGGGMPPWMRGGGGGYGAGMQGGGMSYGGPPPWMQGGPQMFQRQGGGGMPQGNYGQMGQAAPQSPVGIVPNQPAPPPGIVPPNFPSAGDNRQSVSPQLAGTINTAPPQAAPPALQNRMAAVTPTPIIRDPNPLA
jgi:hypothetical protein